MTFAKRQHLSYFERYLMGSFADKTAIISFAHPEPKSLEIEHTTSHGTGDIAMKAHLHKQWLKFMDFYETVYLPDHAAPLNRWVHFLSNVAALLCCGSGLLLQNIFLFAFGVWFQLGPPYLGHILFEKTHRSIDQSPIYAALGSWYTTLQIFLGRQSITHGPKQKINHEQH